MTTTSTGRKQYVFSAATKAKMAASQKARWTAAVVAAPVAKKWKLSAQGKANIIAAAKARGARNAAKKATTPASAPKQAKRVISPEAKARMIAGAKNRWAKVKAGKKKA